MTRDWKSTPDQSETWNGESRQSKKEQCVYNSDIDPSATLSSNKIIWGFFFAHVLLSYNVPGGSTIEILDIFHPSVLTILFITIGKVERMLNVKKPPPHFHSPLQ